MKTLKSLTFREWKLTRRRLSVMLILYILIAVLMMIPLIMFGDIMMTDSPSDSIFMLVLLCGTVALTGGVLAGTNNGLQKTDIHAGWKRYSFVLPATAAQQAMSDLLMKLGRVLLFGLLTVLYTVICAAISGVWELTRNGGWNLNIVTAILNVYLVTVLLVMLVDVTYSFIVMFAKNAKELGKYSLIAFLGAGLIFRVIGSFTGENAPAQPAEGGELISDETMRRIMETLNSGETTLFLLAAFAVLCLVFFLAMRRSHERREP